MQAGLSGEVAYGTYAALRTLLHGMRKFRLWDRLSNTAIQWKFAMSFIKTKPFDPIPPAYIANLPHTSSER
jgi:hypothetical protein